MHLFLPMLATLMLISVIVAGQSLPAASNTVANASSTKIPNKPAAYSSVAKVNYIRTWQPQKTYSLETEITSGRTVDEVQTTTQYLDGLGRPLQSVSWQASPSKKDIVAPIDYDEYGREQYKYLPYSYINTKTTTSSSDGSFKLNPFNDQSNFFNSYKSQQPGYNNETFFYSKTIFESSPLNRVERTFAPGNSWVGSEGTSSEKSISTQCLINNANDAVKIWSITNNSLNYYSTDNNVTINIPTSVANYSPGELYKTVAKDEKGNIVVEYKDKEGKIILKKVQIGAVASDYSGFANWLCTYYIYDDFGQLRFVMPPKAVAKLPSSGVLTTDIINELCFRYEYDERQRMIAKKVPGSGWVSMVYDRRDRLVFTQDANMYGKSPSQWMYTLYDDLNHPVQTGIMLYTGSWDNLRTNMDVVSDGNSISNASGNYVGDVEDMYLSTREPGRVSYQASNSIVMQDGFVSENNSFFTAEIIADPGTGFANTMVTVNTNPIPASATLYPLTYTFYHNYSWTSKEYNTANNANLDDGGNANAEALPLSKSHLVKGLITGTRVRVIEDANNLSVGKWLESVSFYDEKGRVVQVNTDNYKGGKDIVTTRYNFTGKVVCNYLVHNNPSGNITDLKVRSSMLYDHAGRLLKITKQIQQGANLTTRTIVQNQYDDLGQLKNKQIGQKPVGDGSFTAVLENQDYTYNIRGWLKGINWDYTGATNKTQPQTAADKWFAIDLSYDWGFQNNGAPANQFNGNISGIRWMGDGDGEERAYGFNYDKANRLLKGDFTRNVSNTWTKDAIINFDMVMGDGVNASTAYDENGNILKMQQNGMKLSSTGPQSTLIDNMSYNYLNSELSNRLRAATEASITAPDNKLGDFTDNNTTGDDYSYDVNGNLKFDKNKRISLIEYNHLNLPWRITLTDQNNNAKGTITYVYDAVGNKLEKRTDENASSTNGNAQKVTHTSYLGGFVYENNKLQFFNHEEGRVRPIIATAENGTQNFAFDYFIKDHLGNIRSVLTDEVQNEYAIATMEDAYMTTENALFYNIDNFKYPVTSIPGYPADATTNPNGFVARLNGSEAGRRIGPSRVIKVMTGDKLTVSVKSLYKQQTTTTDAHHTWQTIANQLISTLFTGGAPSAVAGKGAASDIANATFGSPSGYDAFFNNKNNDPANNPASKPKAYLNILLFDEDFKLDQTSSRVRYACEGASGALNAISEIDLPVKKNGYAYIYVSNESTENVDVFFDNLSIQQKHGPLLEETHYYPFGLTMTGISSKAAGGLTNKNKYNGKELQNSEFSDGSGLELYDYGARLQDPQIGRWLVVDPMAAKTPGESPYSSMGNNPILNIDPDGNFAVPVHKRITTNAFNNSGLSKGFLTGFETDLVGGATHRADYMGFAQDHHFDSRKNFAGVQATWTKLNNDIDGRIKNIGWGSKKFGGYDVERLGTNVHKVQDFYSHSNYVELYVEYYKAANSGAMPTEVPIYTDGLKIEGFKNLMERTTTDANGKYQGLHSGTFSVWKFIKDKVKGTPDTNPNSHEQMNKDEVDTPEGKLAENVATRHTTDILKRVKEK